MALYHPPSHVARPTPVTLAVTYRVIIECGSWARADWTTSVATARVSSNCLDSLGELLDRASDLAKLVRHLTNVTCQLRYVGNHRGESSVVHDGRWGRHGPLKVPPRFQLQGRWSLQ
eukprot:258591-Pleurochrysis_carterae.AAC.1